ncbi:hypothetical protein ACFX15_006592 [Malus domestica]
MAHFYGLYKLLMMRLHQSGTHIELALCHLAQHEVNAKDMISGGALWELVRISQNCSREDIRSLAHRTLNSSPTFHAEMRRLQIDY